MVRSFQAVIESESGRSRIETSCDEFGDTIYIGIVDDPGQAQERTQLHYSLDIETAHELIEDLTQGISTARANRARFAAKEAE